MYLLRRAVPHGNEIADAVIAIAGMKLNETNPVVSAFTEAYSRIVIYPSRSLKDIDPQKAHDEFVRSNAINRAAMKALNEVKTQGKLILVFPAGTRFRPWAPETKRGVREIDSYIKSFDYMCLVSLNGDILRIQKGDMEEDLICDDSVLIDSSPVLECSAFRESAKAATSEDDDRKQAVVDAIMARLEEMHVRNEALHPKNRQDGR
jgi:glycerol-3-phosphate O-acyltransferase